RARLHLRLQRPAPGQRTAGHLAHAGRACSDRGAAGGRMSGRRRMSLVKVPLVRLAHARSGDKADWVDFGLFAWNRPGFTLLARELSAQRVRRHFEPWLPGEVLAWPLPNLLAFKF